MNTVKNAHKSQRTSYVHRYTLCTYIYTVYVVSRVVSNIHTTIGDVAAKVLSSECLCKQCPCSLYTVNHSVRMKEVSAADAESGVAIDVQVGLVHKHQLAIGEGETAAE